MINTKFRNLKYKIHDLPKDADILEKFPELKSYKAIATSKYPDLNKVLRYIIYLYDPKSDLLKEFPDLASRKRAAATLAGYDIETPELQTIMDFKEKKIVDLIHCFITEIYFGRDYREWLVSHQELDMFTRKRMIPIDQATDDDGKKVDEAKALALNSALRKHCDELHEKLDILEPKLFGGDADLMLIATKSRYTSPEAWSQIQNEAA